MLKTLTIRRSVTVAASVVVAAALLTGCSSAKKQPSPSVSQLTPVSSAPATGIDPLRGTEVSSDVLNSPAISIKVANGDYLNSNASPQWGLDKADIVYEELVEGGITRFVAQYHTDVPTEVGPTRSIRPMDPAIIHPTGGIVAFSGGQGIFKRMIKDTGLKVITEANSAMKRTSERVAPNNLLLQARSLVDHYKGQVNGPGKLFNFATDTAGATAATGEPAAKVVTNFSKYSPRYWKWNSDKKTWQRWQDARTYNRSVNDLIKHKAQDGTQISATNLVVVRVKVNNAKYAAAKYRSHGLVPYTELFGEGKAWVGVDGKGISATWKKDKDTSSPLQLLTSDGQPVKLAPGNTWVELLPTNMEGVSFKVKD